MSVQVFVKFMEVRRVYGIPCRESQAVGNHPVGQLRTKLLFPVQEQQAILTTETHPQHLPVTLTINNSVKPGKVKSNHTKTTLSENIYFKNCKFHCTLGYFHSYAPMDTVESTGT
jgi:hypothetical protein